MEDIEPVKGLTTRKVQHPVYFISSMLRDVQERVTAQIWYPKIWAKFSLFALHCIMA